MAGEDERDTEWRTRQAAPAAPGAARPAPPMAPAAPPRSVDGLAVTALVLGIVGVLLCWLPFIGLLAPLLAIIFGAIAIGRKISVGMGVTGLVLGIICVLVNAGVTIYYLTVHQSGLP